MTRAEEHQRLIHQYRLETGRLEVDLNQVARWAFDRGYQTVPQYDPVEALAKQLARAAREETRIDEVTGRPYRANHAVRVHGSQLFIWGDIDHLSRDKMHKSVTYRREQMVGDAVALVNDVDHWNRINPGEEQLQLELDFSFDVELRLQAGELT